MNVILDPPSRRCRSTNASDYAEGGDLFELAMQVTRPNSFALHPAT